MSLSRGPNVGPDGDRQPAVPREDSEKATMAMTMIPPLVPVDCTPWCTEGDGHTDAEAPDEQFCRSAPHTVDVASVEDGAERLPKSRVFLHLYRDAACEGHPGEAALDPPRIELVAPGAEDALSFSTREARELGELLLRLAATADRSS